VKSVLSDNSQSLFSDMSHIVSPRALSVFSEELKKREKAREKARKSEQEMNRRVEQEEEARRERARAHRNELQNADQWRALEEMVINEEQQPNIPEPEVVEEEEPVLTPESTSPSTPPAQSKQWFAPKHSFADALAGKVVNTDNWKEKPSKSKGKKKQFIVLSNSSSRSYR
jgi:hypothetical protein